MPQLREFPFTPTSSTQLELGDLIPVPVGDDRWGWLQVTDLQPRFRKTLVVGVLPWRGDTPDDLSGIPGLAVVAQGLTRIEMFVRGGAQVVGNASVVPHGLASPYRTGPVGTTTSVWGWHAALTAPTRMWQPTGPT